MPKCHFCDHENPAGADRCESCGTWLQQKAASNPSEPQAEKTATPEADNLDAQLLGLMQGGKKIEAIKLYRAKTGCDLVTAKDAVEALAEKHRINPKGSGCAGVLAILALACVVLGMSLWFIAV